MNAPFGENKINTMRNDNNNSNNEILSTMKRENQEQWWKWRHSEIKSSEVKASLAEWTGLRIRAQILDRTIKHRASVFSWPFLNTNTLPTLPDNVWNLLKEGSLVKMRVFVTKAPKDSERDGHARQIFFFKQLDRKQEAVQAED